jgi:drug/metabolite transporter (DMT)-like permease
MRGYLIVLGGTFIWALTGIVIKILLTTFALEPLVIAFWRVFIVTAFLFLALAVLDRRHLAISPRDTAVFAFYGLVGVAIHQVVWIASVQNNGAAVATVLIYISPAFVSIFAWRFLEEKIDRQKILALILTIVGCIFVGRAYDLSQVQLNPLGLAAGIGSGMTLATYTIMGRIVTRRYSPWTSIFYAFLFGTLFLLPLGLLTRGLVPLGIAWEGWAVLVFLALGPTLGGFGAYTVGLSHLPASVAGILAAFEPVTTAIVAFFVFGEVLDTPQLFGAALILWGIIMLRPRNS